MLSAQFTFNGVTFNKLSDIQSGNYIAVTNVGGLSSPEIIHREDRVIGQHGIVDYYSFIGRRIISLEGGIVGKTESEMLDKLEEFTKAFSLPVIPTNDRDGYHDLVISKSGESPKKISAKVNSLPRIDKDLHIHRMRRFFVELRCEDPRILSITEHHVNLEKATNISSLPSILPMMLGYGDWGGEESIINAGNFGAFPRYRINGPCHNPQIQNVSYPDIVQKFETTLEVGEYIDVDVQAGTAIKNDGSNMLAYETDDSKWITLFSGSNVIRFTTSEEDIGCSLDLYWNDTYMSLPR